MGRHSASSDDEDGVVLAPAVDEATAVQTGRHFRVEQPPAAAPESLEQSSAVAPESVEEPLVSLDEVAPDDGPLGLIAEQMTEPREPPVDSAAKFVEPVAEPVTEPVDAVPDSAAPAEPTGRKTGRGNQSTAADLALLRAHSDVRARVIAALLVPFLLYTAVVYLIGGLGVYFIWIWIPLVSAGVVAGGILDAEHRRRAGSPDR